MTCLGKEIIVDITDVRNIEILKYLNNIEPLMNIIIKELKLNVVGHIKHQFNPIGCTLLYLLSESHLCIHTYPENYSCSLNIYTCNNKCNFDILSDILKSYFNNELSIKLNIIYR